MIFLCFVENSLYRRGFSLNPGYNMNMKNRNKGSSFFRDLLSLNGIPHDDIESFIFKEGMRFCDTEKWWGEGGERTVPHEGLDILYYGKTDGEKIRLRPGTVIPAVSDGEVVLIIDDFIGRSLFVRESEDLLGGSFYSIYAHVKLLDDINPGVEVRAGDPIAAIAELPVKTYRVYPHLHLSMAYIEAGFQLDQIRWEMIGTCKKIHLLDPLDYIDLTL